MRLDNVSKTTVSVRDAAALIRDAGTSRSDLDAAAELLNEAFAADGWPRNIDKLFDLAWRRASDAPGAL